MKVNPNKKAHSSFSKDVHSNKPAKKRKMWRMFFKFAVGTVFLFVMRLSALWILLPWLIYDGWPRLRQVRQLHYHMGSSVMRVGSDTFGDPIFSKQLTKLAIFPDCKHPWMLCLALPAQRKVRKLDFQSELSMSKIIQISLIFFFIEE